MSKTNHIDTALVHQDSIVFIQFKMNTDTQINTSRVTLINKQAQAGRIKPQQSFNSSQNYYLKIVFADSITHQMDTSYIEHPLYKTVEYSDEHGRLNKKDISLKEAEFYIRFLKKNTTFIQIIETTPFVKDHIIYNVVF